MNSRKLSSSPAPEQDIYNSSPMPSNRRAFGGQNQQPRQQTQAASSPQSVASNSDKENASSRAAAATKGKERAVMGASEQDRNGKRRRQMETEANPRPSKEPRFSMDADDRTRDSVKGDAEEDPEEDAERDAEEEATASDASREKDYDPDQDPAVCRQIKKELREVIVEMDGIEIHTSHPMRAYDIIKKANKILPNIKQTSVATIDSRLMVQASNLSYKQTCQLSLGNSVHGIDLDEFVAKCISFMKSDAEADAPSQTQRSSQSHHSRRRQPNASIDDDDEDVDNGDHFNWALLGQVACHRYNSRPAVPGFLLGPLSLEKKARKPVQRMARLKPSQYTQTQPQILDKDDRDQDESKTLTYLTRTIYEKMVDGRKERLDKVEAMKRRNPDMSLSKYKELTEKNGLLLNAGINLWQFVVNPRSFGQTVENIFYLSFLIRDGKARIDPDDDGQLGLFPEEPTKKGPTKESARSKYQGIISMDMAEWKELIDLYDIKESIIQHRNEEVELAVRTWV